MKQEAFVVTSPKDDMIWMRVTPGHFTTSSAHVSHYLDMSMLKRNARVAADVARELAVPYLGGSLLVDTIVCLEGTEIIGAYLAQSLLQQGAFIMNSGADINVLTPIRNMNGQLMFPKNEIEHLKDKRVILLVTSVSSGRTVCRALECLEYYGGTLVGVSALFAALPEVCGQKMDALFTSADIPGYHFGRPTSCEMCQQGLPLDAILTGDGYMDL